MPSPPPPESLDPGARLFSAAVMAPVYAFLVAVDAARWLLRGRG